MGAALVKRASEFSGALGMMELIKGSYFGSVMMTNALKLSEPLNKKIETDKRGVSVTFPRLLGNHSQWLCSGFWPLPLEGGGWEGVSWSSVPDDVLPTLSWE